MTKPRLKSLKAITTWGGVSATFCGIVLSAATGGNPAAVGIAFFGLLLTCCGHWVSAAIAKRDAAEREADKQWLEEIESRLEKSETEAESTSEYFNKQVTSLEDELRDFSMRHNDPVDRD